MHISQKGINLITSFEGCRLSAYKPVSTEKFWTIGYGHYGPDVVPGSTISQGQANELLKMDLKKFEANVNKYDSIYHFSQSEFDALVSFAFNVGSIDQLTANGTRSKAAIADKILAYNKAGGRVLSGLTRRRQAEYDMFVSGDNIPTTEQNKRTLHKGDKGEDVKLLQQKLNDKKIMGGLLLVDGTFGTSTYNCVIEFQAMNNLKKDGIVGTKTWEKLLL